MSDDTLPDFAQVEATFAQHLRTPDLAPAPGDVDRDRVDLYRRLLFNNVESFLRGYFPVVRSVLGEDSWQATVERYFADHRAHTPSFPYMPTEFVAWLNDGASGLLEAATLPPFLPELAHYEWLEAELKIAPEELPEAVPADGEALLAGTPVLNPVRRVAAFRWPVHELGPKHQPTEPPAAPTVLALVRAHDDKVRFVALNPMSARLLELIDAAPEQPALAAVRQVCAELGHPNFEVVRNGARVLLESLQGSAVVLGLPLVDEA